MIYYSAHAPLSLSKDSNIPRFLYQLDGELDGAKVKAGLHIVELAEDVFLDYLPPAKDWTPREIQIGRRIEEFEVRELE